MLSARPPAIKEMTEPPVTRPRTFAVYEVVDAVVPGAIFVLFSMILFWDARLEQLMHWSLGSVAVFMLVAYAAGQLAQIAGTVLEAGWWKMRGGMPHDWPRSGKQGLLPADQVKALEARLQQRLGLAPDFTIAASTAGTWYFLVRQISALVAAAPEAERLDALQGHYRVARGLAAVMFALAAIFAVLDPYGALHNDPHNLFHAGLCLAFGVLALFRMQRIGVQYALELFARFMLVTA